MGQVGILVVELVHALGECQYAGVGIGGLERCQLYASHEKAFHLRGIVLVHFLGYQSAHSLFYGCVVDVEVVFIQSLFVLTLFRSVMMMMLAGCVCCSHIVLIFSVLLYRRVCV